MVPIIPCICFTEVIVISSNGLVGGYEEIMQRG